MPKGDSNDTSTNNSTNVQIDNNILPYLPIQTRAHKRDKDHQTPAQMNDTTEYGQFKHLQTIIAETKEEVLTVYWGCSTARRK